MSNKIKAADLINVGDIYCGIGGRNCYIVNFFKVIKKEGCKVTFQELKNKLVCDEDSKTKVVPGEKYLFNQKIEVKVTHLIRPKFNYEKVPLIKIIHDYNFYKWDNQPIYCNYNY